MEHAHCQILWEAFVSNEDKDHDWNSEKLDLPDHVYDLWYVAPVAAYNNDLQTWCDLVFPTGVFTSKEFLKELLNSEQTIRLSGSSAAHQNDAIERENSY